MEKMVMPPEIHWSMLEGNECTFKNFVELRDKIEWESSWRLSKPSRQIENIKKFNYSQTYYDEINWQFVSKEWMNFGISVWWKKSIEMMRNRASEREKESMGERKKKSLKEFRFDKLSFGRLSSSPSLWIVCSYVWAFVCLCHTKNSSRTYVEDTERISICKLWRVWKLDSVELTAYWCDTDDIHKSKECTNTFIGNVNNNNNAKKRAENETKNQPKISTKKASMPKFFIRFDHLKNRFFMSIESDQNEGSLVCVLTIGKFQTRFSSQTWHKLLQFDCRLGMHFILRKEKKPNTNLSGNWERERENEREQWIWTLAV